MIAIGNEASRVVGVARRALVSFAGLVAAVAAFGCGKTEVVTIIDAGPQGGAGTAPLDAGSQGGTPASDASGSVGTVVVSAATRTPRTTTWSVNYWTWMPSYGDDVTGTETQIAALKPAVIRVGGYNNDANTADPFDNAQLDRALAYAHAVGAEPLIQVPLIADTSGNPPTAATAAAMVTYANVTKGYAIKYFSIGNEPDLYAAQGALTDASKPAFPNYTPSDYCASARAYVTAMKAVELDD